MAINRIGYFCRPVFSFMLVTLVSSLGCSPTHVSIYSPFSKTVETELDIQLRHKLSRLRLKWIKTPADLDITELDASISTPYPDAHIVITEDPHEIKRLAEQGALLSPGDLDLKQFSPEIICPQSQLYWPFAVHLVGMTYNEERLPAMKVPDQWKKIAQSRWRGKIEVLLEKKFIQRYAYKVLTKKYGKNYLKRIQENIVPITTSEPLKNLNQHFLRSKAPLAIYPFQAIHLAAMNRLPIKPIYPLDGVIAVPIFAGILKSSGNIETARKVYRWFFQPQAQNALIHDGVYPSILGMVAPQSLRPWNDVRKRMIPFDCTL